MNGWILLHRKLWQSQNFSGVRNKSNMILVWIWLLSHADEDGVVTFGRKQISNDCGLSVSSVYRALINIRTRLASETNYEANKVFTTIYILNWKEYQRKANKEANSKTQLSERQANTNKEIKNNKRNKEIYKEKLELTEDQLNELQRTFRAITVRDEYQAAREWLDYTGKKYKDYYLFFRGWCRRSNQKVPAWKTPVVTEKTGAYKTIDGREFKTEDEFKHALESGELMFDDVSEEWQLVKEKV